KKSRFHTASVKTGQSRNDGFPPSACFNLAPSRRVSALTVSRRRSLKSVPAGPWRSVPRSKGFAGMKRTQAVAHETGLSQTYLSEVEAGKRNIAIDNIELLATALKINVSEL